MIVGHCRTETYNAYTKSVILKHALKKNNEHPCDVKIQRLEYMVTIDGIENYQSTD
jgi:hypothetical protein